MKKEYLRPETSIIIMETQSILAGSVNSTRLDGEDMGITIDHNADEGDRSSNSRIWGETW